MGPLNACTEYVHASLHPRPLEWRHSGRAKLGHVAWCNLGQLSTACYIIIICMICGISLAVHLPSAMVIHAAATQHFSFHLRSTRRFSCPHSEIAAAALGCANEDAKFSCKCSRTQAHHADVHSRIFAPACAQTP